MFWLAVGGGTAVTDWATLWEDVTTTLEDVEAGTTLLEATMLEETTLLEGATTMLEAAAEEPMNVKEEGYVN
jgi:hypothetical protein